MKCKECKHFQITDKARVYNGATWWPGTAECKEHGFTKTFKSDNDLNKLDSCEDWEK